MKKSDVKNLISAIGKEKKAFFFSDAEHTYLSNGYFIFKTHDHDIAQYIIDSVNSRKRKPEWKNYNYIVIVFGRDNKEIIKEVHNSIKENITYGEILSLEEETVSETVNQVMQMDMFSQAQCVTTVKTTKQGLGPETLDNFLVAIEDYLVKVNKR